MVEESASHLAKELGQSQIIKELTHFQYVEKQTIVAHWRMIHLYDEGKHLIITNWRKMTGILTGWSLTLLMIIGLLTLNYKIVPKL